MAARREKNASSCNGFASIRGLALLVAVAAAGLTGCDRPCDKLANQLCSRAANDDAACEKWKLRIARVKPETCENGLRLLDRERVQ